MATPTLPTEIIIKILSRLPPKLLCRFKCVSKPWQTLINSPFFIKLHLKHSHQNPNLLICHDSLSTAELPLSTTNSATTLRFSSLNHPVNHLPTPTVELLGSSNGILCISDHFKTTIFIYNPSINSYRCVPPAPTKIPRPTDPLLTYHNPIVEKPVDHIIVYGFGYDPSNDDYKLLRVIECYNNRVMVLRDVTLYSMKSDSWKNIDDDLIYPNQLPDGVLVNDVLYFLVSDEYNEPMIKCFDLSTETFSILKMFDYDRTFDEFSFMVKELGGCYCVMVNYKSYSFDVLFGMKLVRADFWVLKENGNNNKGWVRLFSVTDPGSIGSLTNLRPVVYSKDGCKILVEIDGSMFGWYEWSSKKFEKVKARGLPSKDSPFDTYTYVSSLVSVERVEEKAKSKAIPKKNKKNHLDGFLSAGFKLRL